MIYNTGTTFYVLAEDSSLQNYCDKAGLEDGQSVLVTVTPSHQSISFHYTKISVQYTAIFHGYKNDFFQMKNCNIFLIYIFAQNVDCGYTLEPPQ